MILVPPLGCCSVFPEKNIEKNFSPRMVRHQHFASEFFGQVTGECLATNGRLEFSDEFKEWDVGLSHELIRDVLEGW